VIRIIGEHLEVLLAVQSRVAKEKERIRGPGSEKKIIDGYK
jgi:hypothetical protein